MLKKDNIFYSFSAIFVLLVNLYTIAIIFKPMKSYALFGGGFSCCAEYWLLKKQVHRAENNHLTPLVFQIQPNSMKEFAQLYSFMEYVYLPSVKKGFDNGSVNPPVFLDPNDLNEKIKFNYFNKNNQAINTNIPSNSSPVLEYMRQYNDKINTLSLALSKNLATDINFAANSVVAVKINPTVLGLANTYVEYQTYSISQLNKSIQIKKEMISTLSTLLTAINREDYLKYKKTKMELSK